MLWHEGRRAAPPQSPVPAGLGRPRNPRRADPAPAGKAADASPGYPRHCPAVAPPPGRPMPLLVGCELSFRGRAVVGVMVGMHPWFGLSDDVRLGVLTEWVTAGLVDEVLAECGKRDQRPGALPARFMVYYVLALALFQQDSYDDVAENLVGALEGMDEAIPDRSSFTRARQRLGAGVIPRPSPLVSLPPAIISAGKVNLHSGRSRRSSGPQEILRSADPELVRQEVWAHLAVHHCMTRIIMRLAARSGSIRTASPSSRSSSTCGAASSVSPHRHPRRSGSSWRRWPRRSAASSTTASDGCARPTSSSSARPRSTPSARQARSAVLPAGWPSRCSLHPAIVQ